MNKFDAKVEQYAAQAKELGLRVDEDLLTKVTRGLGPSIYLPDASRVSCGDPSELERVKKRFLIKKMGLQDSPQLDAAIQRVCEKYPAKVKMRAIFYYLLVEDLGLKTKY